MILPPFISDKRDDILRIAARHGVRKIRLFGSYARGANGPDSDVDFLIEAGSNTPPWFPGGLIADLQDLLGRQVDVVEEVALDSLLRPRVLAEAVPL